MILWVDFLL
jgi:hypothetical protein